MCGLECDRLAGQRRYSVDVGGIHLTGAKLPCLLISAA